MNDHLLQFKEIAASNQWSAILPEITLAVLALTLLVLEIFFPKNRATLIPRVAVFGQVFLLAWMLLFYRDGGGFLGQETFAGMLYHDGPGQAMRLFFVLSSLLVCYLASVSLAGKPVPRVEFYHITLVVTAALMLLAQSNHFVMLFVALETVTVGFYVLISYFRHQAISLEAGLKYLVLSGLSSAVLLFGIALLYGVAGNPLLAGSSADSMNFGALNAFLLNQPESNLAAIGMVMVLAGLSFKIAAFPFQIWVPDVYQGASTPVTAFLAVASKAAGFAVLLTLVMRVFAPMEALLVPVLTVLATLTILFGNVTALTQRNVKRLMGLSGIAHAGYLLVGVIASLYVPWAIGAVLFYLFTYLLASFAVFGVVAHLSREDGHGDEIEDYLNLARERPLLGGVLVIGLGSLAGIPPLAGFIGKLLIFIAAFQAELYWLLGVSLVGVVLSIYYYFGWIKAAVFRNWEIPSSAEDASGKPARVLPQVSPLSCWVLTSLAVLTVLIGFFQGPLSTWLARL